VLLCVLVLVFESQQYLQCTRGLLKHLRRTKVGDVHARCTLRKRKGLASDPSPAEILEWTRQYRLRSEVMEPRAIRDSFTSGVEVCSQFCTNLGLLRSPGLHRNITLKR
jgi:hypothetical protein